MEEKVLLDWEAPDRPFTKRSKAYFNNLFAIIFILAIVAIFFKEFLLTGALLALAFIQYVLGTVPPRMIKNQITNYGIKTHGAEYTWDELTDFWFTEKDGQKILNVDTKRVFPGRLFLLLSSVDQNTVGKLLNEHLTYHRVPHIDILERLSSEFSRRFRLE